MNKIIEYRINLREIFYFELKSFIGRIFLNTKPKLNKDQNYLNLGCGSNILPEYINADFFSGFKFWKNSKQKKSWQLDLRYPLNCQDEIFDGIYSEHTLEHLYPSQVKKLLYELYRVLKKDSLIRITVPDIEKYVKYYNREVLCINYKEFAQRYSTGCSAIRNITQNYFHRSTWDFLELKSYLEEVGFKNIEKKAFNESADKRLKIDKKGRAWETLYVEATK